LRGSDLTDSYPNTGNDMAKIAELAAYVKTAKWKDFVCRFNTIFGA
jgi:hypothetical protein